MTPRTWINLWLLRLAFVRWLGLAIVLGAGPVLATSPMPVLAEPAPFDRIELNVVYGADGERCFAQWLAWSMQPDGTMTCEGWRMVKATDAYRPWGDPRIILWEEGVIVRGKVFIERHFPGDLEVMDRARWPVEMRRDFKRK